MSNNEFTGGIYNAVTLYRIDSYFRKIGLKPLSKIFKALTHLLFSSTIPSTCQIGEGAYCSHRAIKVVLHNSSVFGKNCALGTSVVFSGRNSDTLEGMLSGGRVYAGTGNKIIGADAVLLNDVLGEITMLGILAKVNFNNE